MSNVTLNLQGVSDQVLRDNFQKISDFINNFGMSQKQFQACEIFVTSNQSGIKIGHSLGGVPLDAFITRLIAPSATRLTFRFSDFTKDQVVVDVTGLAAGETLSARFMVGTFPDAVTVGTVARSDSELQENRSKF